MKRLSDLLALLLPCMAAAEEKLFARHLRITSTLQMQSIHGFAPVSAKRARSLQALRRAPELTFDAFARADQVLVQLPAEHPAGPRDLLLSDSDDRLYVLDRDRKRFRVLARARLADQLDSTGASGRTDFSGELRSPSTERRRNRLLRRDGLVLRFRYTPPQHTRTHWNLKLTLTATGTERIKRGDFRHPRFLLAVPLLTGGRARLALETLTARAAVPELLEAWLDNESVDGPVIRRRVQIDDRGWVPLSRSLFSTPPKGYQRARRLPPSPSRQLVDAEALAGWRKSQPGGDLKISNEAQHSALLYLDGVQVGWVNPGSKLELKGADQGYYRVFAVTPSGVKSWGPKDLYLPGTLTLH